MTATLGLFRFEVFRPLVAAAAIGIATIAPAKARNDTTFAPFSYAVQLNLSDVQADLEDDLNDIRHDDKCGPSWNVTDASVTPVPNGRAIRVNFRARVSETQCTYARRVLISEATTTNHVTFAIDISPKITGNNVSFESKVVATDTTGTLNRLKLDARVKDIVAGRLLDAVEERIKPTIPSGVIRGNAKLGDVSFVDIGGGKLGLSLKTTGRVRVSG